VPFRDRLRRLFSPAKSSSPSVSTPTTAPTSRPEPVQPAQPVARPEHELVLYKYDSCPYCRRVMRIVDKLGLQGTIEYRDTRTDQKWRSNLIERTGRTQVPCLFIDGVAMFESAEIGDWLTSNYG
jgi:glutaredoxin 3